MRYRVAELERSFENLIQEGEVLEVKGNKAKLSITTSAGEFETPFLPILSAINSASSNYTSAKKGAKGIIVCPLGNLATGVIIGFIAKEAEASEFVEDKETIKFKDGASIVYDNNTGVLKLKGIKKVELDAQKLESNASFEVLNLTAKQDVKTGGVSLLTHIHPSASGPTGAPTPTGV